MYIVYGDESHDPNQQRVYAVTGVIGGQADWDAVESRWLKVTGGKTIHAADLESDRGDFKNIPHEDNLQLYRSLVTILADSPLMGYSAVIDLVAYKIFFPDVVENVPYVHCFRRVLEHFGKLAHVLIPQDKIQFKFHTNIKTQFTASELFYEYRKLASQDYDQYFDEIEFISMESTGIQIADLYVRETMKHGFKHFNGDHSFRGSFKRLIDTKRFKADYFEKEYWEDYRNKLPEIEKTAGITRDDYMKWLKEKGLADNSVNRTSFVAYINEMDRRKSKAKLNDDSNLPVHSDAPEEGA